MLQQKLKQKDQVNKNILCLDHTCSDEAIPLIESYSIIHQFMKEINFNHQMKTAYTHIRSTGRLIRHICAKFKNYFVSRLAKEDVFKVKWNRLIDRIGTLSKVKNDKVMKGFVKDVLKVPTEVI
jgi:hypothetical protein